jgi:enoyl-CoA hydratase/carnithine racemase
MSKSKSLAGDQSKEIVLDIDAPIATVTINRADDENRLTRANLERLGESPKL